MHLRIEEICENLGLVVEAIVAAVVGAGEVSEQPVGVFLWFILFDAISSQRTALGVSAAPGREGPGDLWAFRGLADCFSVIAGVSKEAEERVEITLQEFLSERRPPVRRERGPSSALGEHHPISASHV